MNCLQDFCWVSSCNAIGWDIMSNDRACTYNTVIANGDAWHDAAALTEMHVSTYFDWTF